MTSGITDGGYHPTAAVSRQAMAAFLYRAADPGAKPARCTKAPFKDVPATSAFCPQIKWLADTGITGGYTDGGFHPTAPVSRQAMAAFLQRYQASHQPGTGTAPACKSAPFEDVPAS